MCKRLLGFSPGHDSEAFVPKEKLNENLQIEITEDLKYQQKKKGKVEKIDRIGVILNQQNELLQALLERNGIENNFNPSTVLTVAEA